MLSERLPTPTICLLADCLSYRNATAGNLRPISLRIGVILREILVRVCRSNQSEGGFNHAAPKMV